MCLSFSLKTASSWVGLAGCPPTAPATGSTPTNVVEGCAVCDCPLILAVANAAVVSALAVVSTGARKFFLTYRVGFSIRFCGAESEGD